MRNPVTNITWLSLLFAALTIAAQAQTFTTLASFDNTNGFAPDAPLAQGRDGNFYGSAYWGGNVNCNDLELGCGTLFRFTPGGEFTLLYTFCTQIVCADGGGPQPLTLATDGNFYGATAFNGFRFPDSRSMEFCLEDGGCGTVFRLSPDGQVTILSSFASTNGSAGQGATVEGVGGRFYGNTLYGGNADCSGPPETGCGTIFQFDTAGAIRVLHTFCQNIACPDGAYPAASLLQADDGNFYGTTTGGGAGNGGGTIFRMTPEGKLTTIFTFCSQGNCTQGAVPLGMIEASDGNLYGVTQWGGLTDTAGTIFRLSRDGTVTTLYEFCSQPNCGDGRFPSGTVTQGTDGNLYGTTTYGGGTCNCGTIYRITLEGKFTTLHVFDAADGSAPADGLLQGTDGTFYGTTQYGGANDDGSIFNLDVGLGPFVAFVLPAGKVGGTAEILGQGFTGTTQVTFNGDQAAFQVVSDTYLTATVPQGATTGYVTVTTPAGVLKSNVLFRVIQ